MMVRAWWSKTGEILVALDGPSAQRLHSFLLASRGTVPNPLVEQVTDQLRCALREAPPEKV